MSVWDRLKKSLQAVRESPNLVDQLDAAHSELRQVRQALDRSEQECERLSGDNSETKHQFRFYEKRAEALQTALATFCPKLDSLEELIRFYDAVSPSMDPQGFILYHIAEIVTGIDVSSFFPYEDNCGMFEAMSGRQLLRWLTAAYFHAVDWTIVPGTGHEAATLREVDTSTPEHQAFEQKLYRAVLTRMGFEDLLAPDEHIKSQEKEVIATGGKTTELRLYSRLSGELTEQEYDDPEPLDGGDLLAFREAILHGIEDEQMPEEEERGLMTYFDGLEAVNEKVLSLFPSVEGVDGKLYGVAVCQVKGTLTPGELEELKEYCRSQYADGWGEGFAQRPRKTEYGDLYVSFWQDNSFSILTKGEMETAKTHIRSRFQVRREGGER